MAKMVKLPKSGLIREHEELIRLLKSHGLHGEARKQAKELSEYKKMRKNDCRKRNQ